MSDNPARELAELLEAWTVTQQGTTVYATRGSSSSGQGDLAMWRRQIEAARLLAQVDTTLVAMEAAGRRVDHYLRAYPLWCAGLFDPDTVWNSGAQSARQSIRPEAIDQLHALADFIDSSTPVIRIGETERKTIQDATAELMEMLGAEEIGFDVASKRYIFELLSSVQRLANEHTLVGSADLVHRVHELYGALALLIEDLEQAGVDRTFVSRMRSAARRVYPYAKWGAIAGAGVLDIAVNVKAITGA